MSFRFISFPDSHLLLICLESLGTDVLIESRGQGSGLRQRRVHYSEELRQSTDEEDEEEFQLPDRKEERPGFAMSYLIIGALALLCLGSLFFSGKFFFVVAIFP